MAWKTSTKGIFSVKAFQSTLKLEEELRSVFPLKNRALRILTKVEFFHNKMHNFPLVSLTKIPGSTNGYTKLITETNDLGQNLFLYAEIWIGNTRSDTHLGRKLI